MCHSGLAWTPAVAFFVRLRVEAAGDEFTGSGFARNDCPNAFVVGDGGFKLIKAQTSLAAFGVWSMALEAILREDRPNVPVELQIIRF